MTATQGVYAIRAIFWFLLAASVITVVEAFR